MGRRRGSRRCVVSLIIPVCLYVKLIFPIEYFCEECKPERHQALKKWLRSRGRNTYVVNCIISICMLTTNHALSLPFIPPTPEILERLHSARDPYPPSQSKRWTEYSTTEPLPPKLPARSHHKKQQQQQQQPQQPQKQDMSTSTTETGDGRRTRGRQSTTREKPPSSASAAGHGGAPSTSSRKDGRRGGRKQSMNGMESENESESSQNIGAGTSLSVKKRSTMNSRDAAYEEAVKAAMEASRKEMAPQEEGDVNPEAKDVEGKEKDRPRAGKRRRNEDEEFDEEEKEDEKDKPRKGKRRKEDETGGFYSFIRQTKNLAIS